MYIYIYIFIYLFIYLFIYRCVLYQDSIRSNYRNLLLPNALGSLIIGGRSKLQEPGQNERTWMFRV